MEPQAHTICIAVLAHNEEDRIDACLNSLPEGRADISIHVIVNGSTDNTAAIASEFARDRRNFFIHDWPQGGKSRSWNRIIFDILENFADIHVFVDGDAVVKDGSIDAMANALLQNSQANAAAAMPLNGKNADLYRQEMMHKHGIFGDLYALKGSFLKRMKASNIRLPNDLIGDDGLIGALAKCDLKNEDSWDNDRLLTCADAGFYCEPNDALNMKSWAKQYSRMTNYSLRHFQNRIISDIMKSDGARGLPENLASLYGQYLPHFAPRKQLPNFWFDRLAHKKMAAHLHQSQRPEITRDIAADLAQ